MLAQRLNTGLTYQLQWQRKLELVQVCFFHKVRYIQAEFFDHIFAANKTIGIV